MNVISIAGSARSIVRVSLASDGLSIPKGYEAWYQKTTVKPPYFCVDEKIAKVRSKTSMDNPSHDFHSLLVKHTNKANKKAEMLTTEIIARFGDINGLDEDNRGKIKANIDNWLAARTNKTNQWLLLVAILAVLGLSENDADEFLIAAGQPNLHVLMNKANEQQKRLFETWTRPVFHQTIERKVDDLHAIMEKLNENMHPPQLDDLTEVEAIYRQQIVEAYGHHDFSGFEPTEIASEYISLERVFIRPPISVQVRGPNPSLQNDTDDAWPTPLWERSEDESGSEYTSISLGQALSEHLVLLGEPGAGKSTLLKWLALTFAQRIQRTPDRIGSEADADRLPILIDLSRIPHLREQISLLSSLPHFIVQQEDFAKTPLQWLDQVLQDGRCLLLFDGLDEVVDPSQRTRLVSALVALARRSLGNRIVIGSRPEGLRTSENALASCFRRCQLQRFTLDTIQDFFRKWYNLNCNLTEDQRDTQVLVLFNQIKDEPRLLELAATPLLCTMLLLTWQTEGNLPKQRVVLYERFCRALLQQWETHHAVKFQDLGMHLTMEHNLRILAALAYELHTCQTIDHQRNGQQKQGNRALLVDCLVKELTKSSSFREVAHIQIQAEKLLDILGSRSTFFHYQGKDREGHTQYAFTHLTFQEYLAACHLATFSEDQWIDGIMTHLHDAKWQQVHLLTIGIMSARQNGFPSVLSLLNTIIYQYPPPTLWALQKSTSSPQLERCLTWLLGRNIKFCIQACISSIDTTIWDSSLGNTLLTQIEEITLEILSDEIRSSIQHEFLILLIHTLLQHRIQFIKKTIKDLQNSLHSIVDSAVIDCLGEIAATENTEAIELLRQVLPSFSQQEEQMPIIRIKCQMVQGGDQQSLQELLQALRDPHQHIRDTIIMHLKSVARTGNQSSLYMLFQAQQEHNEEVQHAIIEICGAVAVTGNKQALDIVLQAAQHIDEKIRIIAIKSLGNITTTESNQQLGTMPILFQALQDSHEKVRSTAASRLVQLAATGNKQALNTLFEATQDPSERVRQAVINYLESFTIPYTDQILRLVAIYPDRGEALQALLQGLEKSQSEQVLQVLLPAMQQHDSNLYWLAMKSLAFMANGGSQQALYALLQAVQHPKNAISCRALHYLEPLVVAGKQEAIDIMFQMARNPDIHIQATAIEGLSSLAATGKQEAIDIVFQAVQHTDEKIRKSAIKSLSPLVAAGSQQAITALFSALQDPHPNVRKKAAEGLEPLAVAGNEQATQALLNMLHDSQASTFGCLMQVGITGNQRVVHALLSYLQDADPIVRLESMIYLEQQAVIDNELVINSLLWALKEPDIEVCKEALENARFIHITSPEQFHVILKALMPHTHTIFGAIRSRAFQALDSLLDGQCLPCTQWIPIQQQRTRKQRLKRGIYGLLLLIVVLAIVGIEATKFGYFELSRWLLLLLGVIIISLVIVAFVVQWLRGPLRVLSSNRASTNEILK